MTDHLSQSETSLEVGMLLLDPENKTVYAVASRRSLIAHHGTCSERSTLRKPGILPAGWRIIDNRGLAALLGGKLENGDA